MPVVLYNLNQGQFYNFVVCTIRSDTNTDDLASFSDLIPDGMNLIRDGNNIYFRGTPYGPTIHQQLYSSNVSFFVYNAGLSPQRQSFSWKLFKSQSITIAPISDKQKNSAPFKISGPSSSSGLAVSFSIASGSPATMTANSDGTYTITLTGSLGVVTLVANQAGNDEYTAAVETTVFFNVTKIFQTITPFAKIENQLPTVSNFTITPPTASSGLTVAVSVKSGPATISGNTVTLTGSVGTVVLGANQAGNADYSAANEVTIYFVVAKQTVGIALSNLRSTYSGSPHPVTVTTSPSGFTPTVTYNGSTTVPVNAGIYTVSAIIDEVAYTGSFNAILYIAKAPATVTLSGSTSINYDGSSHGLTATTTPSGLSVRITYNGSSTPPVTSGTYSVVATITNSNYVGNATSQIVISGQPYYYNNATGDGLLYTLGNWWTNSAHTISATQLPTFLNDVYIDGHIELPGSYFEDSGIFITNDGSFSYSRVIVGKYSTATMIPLGWWWGGGSSTQFGDSSGILCNSIEFWNGAFVDPRFPGGATIKSAIVHYPCVCPLVGLSAQNGISYVGYPYVIANSALDLPIQTVWIDQSSHGTARWSAVLPVSDPALQPSIPLGAVKENDDFLFQVAFHSGNNFSDPKITTISCTFIDPASGSVILSSTQFSPIIAIQLGSSGYFSYLFSLSITNSALSDCLGFFGSGIAESVTLIGEVKWQEINDTGVGPAILTRRSQNFPLVVTRSLNSGADFSL